MNSVKLCLALLFASGCAGWQASPRATARAVVVTIADGVRLADKACASVEHAKSMPLDAKIKSLKACAVAYNTARKSLLAAEASLDAWSDAEAKNLVCAIADSAHALTLIYDAVRAGGATPPQAVDDALSVARAGIKIMSLQSCKEAKK